MAQEEQVDLGILRLRRRAGSGSSFSGPSWSLVEITLQLLWSEQSDFEPTHMDMLGPLLALTSFGITSLGPGQFWGNTNSFGITSLGPDQFWNDISRS